jgi:hypothetical protein
MTYTLYGIPASLYTGKARSYLRKQGVDFVELAPSSDRYLNHIVPAVGRWIIPVMETPDGRIVQDGADIIDHFERGDGRHLVRYPAYPLTPVHLAVGHVFELFGGEGLLRPAMHYRWNFDEMNLAFIQSEFSLNFPGPLSDEETVAAFNQASGRMRKAAGNFGVSAETGPTIEAAFGEWLDLFSAHLRHHPYLLGGRPTIGDYGLMAAMWAHLNRDPAPQLLIKQRAPRVGRWVERMATTEPYQHEYEYGSSGELIADDAVPATLLDMLCFVAEEYLGEISAHVEAANRWLADRPDLVAGTNGLEDPAARGLTGGRGVTGDGVATFDWRGHQITTTVLPYRFWLLQHLHDDLATADAAQQARVRAVLASAGLEPLLDLRTLRRVERVDNLEVWGPPI